MEIETSFTESSSDQSLKANSIKSIVNKIDRVFINKDSVSSEVAENFIKSFPKEKIKFVTSEPFSQIKGDLSANEFSRSKRNIYIKEFKGKFFKRCPGARPGLTCCNYFVLNLGQQCDLNCSYCYLQSFINSPTLAVYSNINQAFNELQEIAKSLGSDTQLRVGTGEIIDSLSLDPITNYSKKLIHFFKDYPNWQLEFKTKSDFVETFLNEDHKRNVVVSWSVNPQEVIDSEEHETASLKRRLAAAKKCKDKGFLISFHVDPMIYHPEWKTNYKRMVSQITNIVDAKDTPYVSVGALRFQPQQIHMMRERFGMKGMVTSAEVFSSKDGKLRYDKKIREEMFRFILEEFRSHDSKWNIFLCMESPEVWLNSMNQLPTKKEGIRDLFNHRVIQKIKSLSPQN